MLGVLAKPVVGPMTHPPLEYGSIYCPYKYFPLLFYSKMVHIRVEMVGRWSLWKLEVNAMLKDTYMSGFTGTDHAWPPCPSKAPYGRCLQTQAAEEHAFLH